MELLLTEGEILERVDEYALYSFYLGYEPLLGAAYPSPIRRGINAAADLRPSFSVYEPTRHVLSSREFMWHDNARGISGGIFKLVKLLFGYTTDWQSYQRVLGDFGYLDGYDRRAPLELPDRKSAVHADIAVLSRPFERRDLAFWERFNIRMDILQRYGTRAMKCYWLSEVQDKPRFPTGLGYAYPIWDKYQLYCPHDTTRKFRTSWNDACLPGFLQLEYNQETLVITKSVKDVMCLRSFGYESVACRSENTLVPQEYMNHFRRQYRRIRVLFDNDGKHKGDEYPEPKVFVPRVLESDKDPSDFCKNHGVTATADMLRQIIEP